MSNKNNNQSVILLVEEFAEETNSVKHWLEENNFHTHETASVFDALEEINDFTISRCPDVVLLTVDSPANDCGKVTEIIRCYSDSHSVSVVALPRKTDDDDDNYTQLFADQGNFPSAHSQTATGKFL